MGFGEKLRNVFHAVGSLPPRIIDYYVGPVLKNTIEYWQGYIFYVIALSGIVAGTLCLIPTSIVILIKGQFLGAAFLVLVYAVNVYVITSTRFSVRVKAQVIALNFSLFGMASLILAGPEGESGIWYSVSVLICSLFVGFRDSLFVAIINFLTGITFGILHAKGVIGWDVLVNFKFTSWLVQGVNVFLMDMTFAIANTLLIRGVDATFKSLNAAEGRIRASLEEKETLIRELYHRSKNNMQVVSSLLSLHSAEMREESAKEVLEDIMDKIGSMSLVHQKLYESRDLSNIDMAEYIRDLVTLLMESHKVSPAKVDVSFALEDLSMLIDTAIPCGLVISEIMSNSLKHAFPGDRTGRIDIGLKKVEDDDVELRISDNGIGLTDGFDAANDGKMGMKTVFTMVKHQLQGSIQCQSRGGVAFIIRFKRKLYEERVQSDGSR